jgi:3-oxoacyl-(acyl-carrier-protein) synthase
MVEAAYIQKVCVVRAKEVVVDAVSRFSSDDASFVDFYKKAFRELNPDYPKFFKMDALSKLAVLAAEYLLEGESVDDLALVLANRSGSLDTDVRHQAAIQHEGEYFPSPATFVYTLANICAGEISIRHGLQTENAFFVSENYPIDTAFSYTEYLLKSGKASQVLCGWVELFEEKYEAVLYLVSPKGTKKHTAENIKALFA